MWGQLFFDHIVWVTFVGSHKVGSDNVGSDNVGSDNVGSYHTRSESVI